MGQATLNEQATYWLAGHLSRAMRQVLFSLVNGQAANNHCRGRSEFGACTRTVRSLIARGLVTREEKLTRIGREVAKRLG